MNKKNIFIGGKHMKIIELHENKAVVIHHLNEEDKNEIVVQFSPLNTEEAKNEIGDDAEVHTIIEDGEETEAISMKFATDQEFHIATW